jgi:hypothetical protein
MEGHDRFACRTVGSKRALLFNNEADMQKYNHAQLIGTITPFIAMVPKIYTHSTSKTQGLTDIVVKPSIKS